MLNMNGVIQTASSVPSSPLSSASPQLRVVIFLGSVREGRVGSRVAKFMQKHLENTRHIVSVIDAKELNFEVLRKPLFYYADRNQAPKWLVEAEKVIRDADAYVVITGEYNHCIPPGLSNMLDHFGSSVYSFKPSGIISYSPGIYGGMRAAMQLRVLLNELGCISVSHIFGIPEVHKQLDPEGNPLSEQMDKGAKKLLQQLDWYAWALKNHRDKHGVPPSLF